jgi:glutamate 5-kinase
MGKERASVYATDVLRVDGQFSTGQVVEIRSEADALLGRGATSYPSDIARAWSNNETDAHGKSEVILVRWDQLTKESTP